ncbi:MAG: aminomethyl-transferring glycine dehydrogenase subunit GcvPA [candidate division Zixibacteria bacterium]
MSYIPNSPLIRRRMLDEVGISDFEELIKSVPASLRLQRPLILPNPLSELELEREVREIAARNSDVDSCFAGGGAYDHFIPAAVDHILLRSEYYTAYTPYQAEVSQGTLQTMYEFQTFISRLTGLGVTSASLYDGATALAEAVLLAASHTRKNEILISQSVNPYYIETVETYLSGQETTVKYLKTLDGTTDIADLRNKISDKTAAVVIQNPNFFGQIERIKDIASDIKSNGALLIEIYDPLALGILSSPAENGADLAVAEGQGLGISLNFGGPYLGLLSARREFLRKMPGRLSGRTKDKEGRVGYVMTLQTREQHIRRERATSNICTNQALCALAASVYMSLLGQKGLEKIGRLCLSKARYAAEKISELPGYSLKFTGPFFKEFVIETPIPPARINNKLLKKGILAGIDMGKFKLGMKGCLMVAVTEKRSKRQIDDLVFELSKAG